MDVKLIEYTKNAKELLIFSKRTRHLSCLDEYNKIFSYSEEKKREELGYVFSTISSSWEFVDYIFLISGVTRAFTHQLVRHRVGTAFAQQTQRGANMENFDYLATGGCRGDVFYEEIMEGIRKGYKRLIDSGKRIQDARGVLPTNILTNILFKANLRTLNHILNLRLCFRAQGEFQEVARAMRREVINVHPWAEPVLQVYCVEKGVCLFPRFEDCPLKKKYKHLCQIDNSLREMVKKTWEDIIGCDLQPVCS